MFDKIKNYYNDGLWSLEWVWNAVGKAITEDEYERITKYVYPAKEALSNSGTSAYDSIISEDSL